MKVFRSLIALGSLISVSLAAVNSEQQPPFLAAASTRMNEIRGAAGLSCAPLAPVPNIPGPIEAPEVLEFPPETVIGGTVTVQVNVSVDDVSSASREDFYLLSDATGSMRDEIFVVQQEIMKLVRARREASNDVVFGVGYYRDEEDDPPFRNVQSLTNRANRLTRAINRLEAIRGGDLPEANLVALSEIATSDEIGWRLGSRKILVYFGDAPGHEPTCPGGRSQLTRETVISQLNERGIAVMAVNFGNNNSGINARTESAEGENFGCGVNEETRGGQANDITAGTKGLVKSIFDPRELVDVIIEGVGSLDQVLSVNTTDCEGRVAIRFNPQLPIAIAAGETRSIIEEAEILPGACETPEGFRCEIDILLSGVGVRQVIQTSTIAGCVSDDGFFS